MQFFLISTVSMLVVLGIMVLVHETGHFITAKLCGVRIEVFSIGFGKRLLGCRRGDTDYRLSLLPLGGYVKMAGELPGEDTSHDPAEFQNRPRWQRILIGFSGPISNFLLAFGLMTGLYMMHNEIDQYMVGAARLDYVPVHSAAAQAGLKPGDTIVQFDSEHNPDWQHIAVRMGIDGTATVPVTVARPTNGSTQNITVQLPLAGASGKDGPDPLALGLIPRIQAGPLTVRTVAPSYPLAKAGIEPGDALASLNGVALHSTPAVSAYLQENGAHPVAVAVERKGKPLQFTVDPVQGDDGTGRMGYRLGFQAQPPPFVVEQEPFGKAAARAYRWNVQNAGDILEVVKKLFSRHSPAKQLMGPVGIARVTGEAVTTPGWQPLINLMAVISLNLGVMNLFPFPILDGGMILLLIIESVMRHDLNTAVKERIYQVAFVLLIVFFVYVTFNDVSRVAGFSKLRP